MLRGMNRHDAKESAMRWLARVGMTEYADKKLNTLSKGNQQKIQLAATLVNDPDIIILDEPFSGLDPVNAQMLKDIVGELIDSNKIVLFSSHQMGYVCLLYTSSKIISFCFSAQCRKASQLRANSQYCGSTTPSSSSC